MTKNAAESPNAKLGLALFFIYSLFYAGFVFVNAFAAQWGEWIVLAGLNLAVVWGFSLIILAFLLALAYGIMCRTDGTADSNEQEEASK